MRGPGVPRGSSAGQLVTNADLAPTILDAADAGAGRAAGRPLAVGLIERSGRPVGARAALRGRQRQDLTFTALRNYRWKYVEHAPARPSSTTSRRSRRADQPARRATAGAACAPSWRRGWPRCGLRGQRLPRQAGLRLGAVRRRRAASPPPCAATTRDPSSPCEFLVRRRPRRKARRDPASFRRLARDATRAVPQRRPRRRRAARAAAPAARPRAPRRRAGGHADTSGAPAAEPVHCRVTGPRNR